MDRSPMSSPIMTSPVDTPECPMLVVTGPTSLVKSPSTSSGKRVSDAAEKLGPRRSDFGGHLASQEVTSRDDTAALSDGELDRHGSTNRRIVRSRHTTLHGQRQRPSVFSTESTDSDISHLDISLHKHLRASDSVPGGRKYGTLPRKRRSDSKRPSRRISCKDLGSGQCQGWLMKKKEPAKSKSWVKRWFVLSRRSLYYYKTEQDVKAEGVIYVPGFKISPAPEMKTKKFAFKAHHSGTTFYFAAERQDDMAKWMNKLGLASLDDLELSDAALTAGFWKPPEMMPPLTKSASHLDVHSAEYKSSSSECICSESDNDDVHSSCSNSREDITALYRDIRSADLDLAGSNVRDRRSVMLLSIIDDDSSNQRDDTWRHLLSLNRTLKDREQTLSAIDVLLRQLPVTSAHLADLVLRHPEVIAAGVQQPPDDKKHLSAADDDDKSSADGVHRDAVSLSAADTAADSVDGFSFTPPASFHQPTQSPCTSPRLLISPTTSAETRQKPRRPSQETAV